MEIEITQLAIYPIKSCAGIVLTRSEISGRGLKWDREWVVVDAKGKKLTQRSVPSMALIQPTVIESHLVLEAPNRPSCAVSLERKETSAVFVRIWDDLTKGCDEGDEVATWLSSFLDQPCRLLRVHSQAQRSVDLAWIHKWQRISNQHEAPLLSTHFGFADGFPFLICNEASLTELNQVILANGDQTIEMSRFRPNISVRGLAAYEEDYVLSFTGSGHYFAKLKNCTRCPLPNVNPTTAQIGDQPALALAQTRKTREGILFGVNAGLYKSSEASYIEIGQRLQVELEF